MLACWREGAAKRAILELVSSATTPGPGFVEVADRIATFDNDGTLWVGQPLPPRTTPDEFDAQVREWLETVKQPKLGVPYIELVYQPMLELLDYLRAHEFRVFVVSGGGTAAAFVADPGETISPTIIDWVEAYVPNQIGDGKYLPHITVGVAKFDDLKVIDAEPFDAFSVHPKSVSVYHLGNHGTARAELKSWQL